MQEQFCQERLDARGGSLRLVAGADRIVQTLPIAGLGGAFALHLCVQDAITAASTGRRPSGAKATVPGMVR